MLETSVTLHPAFCITEDWLPYATPGFQALTLQEILALSRRELWCAHAFALVGQQRVAIWRRTSIAEWFSSFGQTYLKALLASGFLPKARPTTRQPKFKRKMGGSKPKVTLRLREEDR